VLAVASVEGGVRYGAVGDGGTSFGPFQLHEGGALPRGKSAAWANSPAGLDYAIGRIAASGARGLTGRAAIEAIVRNFERPAAPGAEIDKAHGRYGEFAGIKGGKVGSDQAGQAFATSPAGIAYGPNPAEFKAQAASFFMAQATAAAAGQPLDFTGLAQLAAAKQQLATADATYAASTAEAAKYGGSIEGPKHSSGNGVVDSILSIAHKQIGKPYVWGAESPSEGGFDCSGLIDYAYRKAGVKLPGRLTTYSILKMGQSVKGGQYRPGDMVVTNGGKHVVMYVGNGQVIAAPHTGSVVQYQPLSRFHGDIVDVRRVL
jgi:cell wall-associated NlpC family hydrolase